MFLMNGQFNINPIFREISLIAKAGNFTIGLTSREIYIPSIPWEVFP